MRTILALFIAVGFVLPASAGQAPEGMTEFNKQCPAKRLCPVLESTYQECKSQKSTTKCVEFVESLKSLSPLYDCQRPIDKTETVQYIVPAIWVCALKRRENGIPVMDEYFELLSTLKIPAARQYFASREFRKTLDGYYAELYLDASEKAEAELKKARNW
jgi:hypothetical protein